MRKSRFYSLFIIFAFIFTLGFYFNNLEDVPPAAWGSGSSIPNAVYKGAGVGYVKNDTGIIYVLGGTIGNNVISPILQIFNMSSNTWTTGTQMPGPAWYNDAERLRDS